MRYKHTNFIGQIINKISIFDCFRNNKRTFFKCVCFCGKEFITRSEFILDGLTKSCGCSTGLFIASKTTKENNANQLNSLIRSYKSNIQKKELKYNLPLDFFINIIAKNCHYCDFPPHQEWIANRNRKNYLGQPIIYNGIDRLNSNIGYVVDNVVPACSICNMGKSDSSYETFMSWIARIVKYQISPHDKKIYIKHQCLLQSTEQVLIYDTLIIGETYGYLIYIEKIDKAAKHKGCKCICICGKIVYRDSNELLRGVGKSCGCKKGFLNSLKTTKPNSHSQFTYLYAQYKSGARKRDINFQLSFDEFKNIIINNCKYCGIEAKKFSIKSFGNKNYNMIPINHNGIDRVDSNKAYFLENCVACCETCNRVKNDLSYEHFITYINRLIVKYGNQ